MKMVGRVGVCFVPVLLLAVSGGCAHIPSDPSERFGPADYYPLALGNSWTYSVNTLGQVTEQTVMIVGRDGEYFTDNASPPQKVQIDASGIRDEHRYLLQRPLAKGTHWKSVVSVTSVESYEIVSTGQKVITTAGAFDDCIVVRSTNPVNSNVTLVNDMTFAPHVGIVKVETQAVIKGESKKQNTLELVRYKVAATGKPANGAT